MRKIGKFLTSEEFIIAFFSLVLLLGSYGPLLYQFLFPPAGKVFLGTLGYPDDFWGNMTSFQEGRLGHWRHFFKISSTFRPQPTLVKFDYLLLGQLSRLFPLDGVFFFHLARFFLSIAIVSVSFILISQIFKSKTLRLTAFLLAFFSTGLFPRAGNLLDLWTPLTVFQRIAYYPHYLFSFLFILLAILFLIRFLEEKRKLGWLLFAAFWGFLAAQVHPPTILSLFLTFPFYLLFLLIKKAKFNLKNKQLWQETGFLILFTLISSLPLFYLYHLSQSPPWNIISKWDLIFNFRKSLSLLDFFLGIGPLAPLALIGSFLAVKSGKVKLVFLAPWSFVYFLGFWFIWKIIGYNSARFLQTPFFIILGILSTLALQEFAVWLRSKKPNKFKLAKKERLVVAFIVALLLLLNIPAYRVSLAENSENFKNDYSYVNSPKGFVKALDWLRENTREEDVVLANPEYGKIIAGLTGNWPFLTTTAWNLTNYYHLERILNRFLCQELDGEFARQFVLTQNISYVFWGPIEKENCYYERLKYSFLEKVFETNDAAIYRVSLSNR